MCKNKGMLFMFTVHKLFLYIAKTVVFNCSAESVSFIKNVFFTCYLNMYYIVNSVLNLDNKSLKSKNALMLSLLCNE